MTLAALLLLAIAPPQSGPTIRLADDGAFEVVGLDRDTLGRLDGDDANPAGLFAQWTPAVPCPAGTVHDAVAPTATVEAPVAPAVITKSLA